MDNREMIFTEELMHKARESKSAEEIITLAKENGVNITEAQAEEYFKMLCPVNGKISDEELDNVSGGYETVTVNGETFVRVEAHAMCITGHYTAVTGQSTDSLGSCTDCGHLNNTNTGVCYCGYYEW